jgi:phosphoribosylaminoimidazole-succinocarboxamide synthase
MKMITKGKAKTMLTHEDRNHLIMRFRDDTSAFNGLKTEAIVGKGYLNNHFNHFIMKHLEKHGIETHIVQLINDTDTLVHKMQMFPIECVIRNRAAGSICKRLGLEQGLVFEKPLFEFFLKDDDLGDPLITEEHILLFKWANQEQINEMKRLSHTVNDILTTLFLQSGFILVDFKLEFGIQNGKIRLADEFTPDGCRLWDVSTLEKMDKDRFRLGLGSVIESYKAVAIKIGVPLS